MGAADDRRVPALERSERKEKGMAGCKCTARRVDRRPPRRLDCHVRGGVLYVSSARRGLRCKRSISIRFPLPRVRGVADRQIASRLLLYGQECQAETILFDMLENCLPGCKAVWRESELGERAYLGNLYASASRLVDPSMGFIHRFTLTARPLPCHETARGYMQASPSSVIECTCALHSESSRRP